MNSAIEDTEGAIDDLTAPALSAPDTVIASKPHRHLKLFFANAMPFADDRALVVMTQAEAWLDIAERNLLVENPNNDF